ncbi:hypothetical protein LOD99_16313 [Oopsacas minuta]|uniref:BTB domain-containing protein n=1 Tax=Oopsacas minuta TaxID=111878 RepID=A0AAV7K7F3_9METZ|nr:hypothetical protein LOD99_16313 [Oopsacas minuta]
MFSTGAATKSSGNGTGDNKNKTSPYIWTGMLVPVTVTLMDPKNQSGPSDPMTNMSQVVSLSTNSAANQFAFIPSSPGETAMSSQFKLAAEAFQHLKSFQTAISSLNSSFNYDSSVNFSSNCDHIMGEDEICEEDKNSISINFNLENICARIGGPLGKVSIEFLKKNPSLCELLIDSPFLADAKIVINRLDEYTYYVHKNVLVDRSLYFNKMLTCEFKEGSDEDIHLELKHPESFYTILYYLYTEKLPSRLECESKWRASKEEYYNLVWTGHYLQIDSLTNKLAYMFEFSLTQCDKFRNEYMPIELFLKRMSNYVTGVHSKSATKSDGFGKCKKCKINIIYLETVLVYASNSNDIEVCKTVIEWSVRHNLSKHVKAAKLAEKIPQLSPMLRKMIDPLGLIENMNGYCKEDSCPRDFSHKHTKNLRHNGLVMIGGQSI